MDEAGRPQETRGALTKKRTPISGAYERKRNGHSGARGDMAPRLQPRHNAVMSEPARRVSAGQALGGHKQRGELFQKQALVAREFQVLLTAPQKKKPKKKIALRAK